MHGNVVQCIDIPKITCSTMHTTNIKMDQHSIHVHVHVLCTSFVERATKCLATADSCRRECETEQDPMMMKILAHCVHCILCICF